MKPWTIHQGDCRQVLASLPAESVHCVVTSPPYWNLRDYGTATWEGGDPGCDHSPTLEEVQAAVMRHSGLGAVDRSQEEAARSRMMPKAVCPRCGATRQDQQIGLEDTPDAYVQRMVEVFREVRRVLRRDGSLWLNLGDSYAGSGRGPTGETGIGDQTARQGFHSPAVPSLPGLKPKDLCGIPWRVALALQADGWWLRSDIIWAKNNPMPSSVTDRPTTSHEYVFLLAKSATYHYDQDAIREITGREADPEFYAAEKVRLNGWTGEDATGAMARQPAGAHGHFCHPSGRNKRTVWTIPSEPYPSAHFATFPTRLVEPCVQAGTSQRGCCPVCAAPWERMTENIDPRHWTERRRNGESSRIWAEGSGGGHSGTQFQPAIREERGWRPTCRASCPGHREEPVPCVVLDPFCGSGTSGEVALAFGRRFVGIELNPSYIQLAEQRLTLLPSYTGRRKAAPKTDAGQLSILEEVA